MNRIKRTLLTSLTVILIIALLPITALAYDFTSYGQIGLNSTQAVDLSSKGGVEYQFKPSTAGYYIFYSSGSFTGDPYFYLASSADETNHARLKQALITYGKAKDNTDAYNSCLAYNDDGAGSGRNFSLTYYCTANVTYYCIVSRYNVEKTTANFAIKSAASYNVTYSANGGSGAPTAQTKIEGLAMTLTTSKPSFTGWTFMGWATSQANADAGTVTYASGANYTANAAQTLYAVWQRAVTLDNQGATTAGSTSVTATYKGTLPEITTPKRNGYSFGGYYTSTNGGGTKHYNSDGTSANIYTSSNSTLYAYWLPNTSVSGSVTIAYTYENDGEPAWVPENTRASSAVVTLWRKTTGSYAEVTMQTVNFDTEGDSDTQSYSFAELPSIDGGGDAYTYMVTTELSNYDVSYNGNNMSLVFNPNNFDAAFEITPLGVSNPPAFIRLKILWRDDDANSDGQIISQHENVYIDAEYNPHTGKYSGSYPVWKYDHDDKPYEYQLLLMDGQGLANIQYGGWIEWNGLSPSGTMTATFETKKQTAVKDNTTGGDFKLLEQSSNLDEVFDRVVKPAELAGDSVVTLTLNVEDIGEETYATEEIKAIADRGSEVYFFDATLVKTVDGSVEALANVPIPVKLHIALTGELADKTYYRVYRYHDGVAEQISSDKSKKEYYVVDVANSEIIIYTMKFSTYAIFGNDSPLNMGDSYAVDVQAKVTGEGGAVYKIDLAWGAMTFEYSISGVWNPETHSYDNEVTVGWLPEGFHGGNNQITAWNHSNGDVKVSFSVIPENGFGDVTMKVYRGNSTDSLEAVGVPLGKVPQELAEAESIDVYLWLDGEPENLTVPDDKYTKIAVITATIEATGGELTREND